MYALLPLDILILIVELVPIYSRWAFTQICKRWRSARKVLTRRESLFATGKTTDGLSPPELHCNEMWWNEYVYWATKCNLPSPSHGEPPIYVAATRMVARVSRSPNLHIGLVDRISVLLKVGDVEALEPWIGAVASKIRPLMDFIPPGTATAVWDMIMMSDWIDREQKRDLITTIPVAFPEVLKKYLPAPNVDDNPVRLNRMVWSYRYETRKAEMRQGVDLIMQGRNVILDGLVDANSINYVVLGRIIMNLVARREYENIITMAVSLKNHSSIYDELSPQASDIYRLLVSLCHGGLTRPNYDSDSVCPCEVLSALINYDHIIVLYNRASLDEAQLICRARGHDHDDDFAKLATKMVELDEYYREAEADLSSPPVRDDEPDP